MSNIKNMENWIDSFSEGSEKDYHGNLYRIIKDIDLQSDKEELGLALMFFLDRCDIIAGDFNTISHPGAGSTFENANFVSNLFADIKMDALQWKNRFLQVKDDSPYEVLIEWWKEQFRRSKIVDEIIC
jgi:hypothetical protein